MTPSQLIMRARSASANGAVIAIVSIVFAVFLLSLSDALVKLTQARFTLGQLVFFRSAMAVIFMFAVVALLRKRAALRLVNSKWVWIRSACLTLMWFLYYAALPSMSFALASAEYYTSPLWMAIFSRFLLGKRVGAIKWVAVTLGFTGVLVILKPTSAGISPVMLLPLLAAICYALAAVITWSKCPEETPYAMALNLNVTLAIGGVLAMALLSIAAPAEGAGFVLTPWRAIGLQDVLLLALLAVFLVVITTLVARAYQLAPSPMVGTFDNAYLAFGILWSAALFHEPPTLREGWGIALIGLAAILASLPERQGSSRRRVEKATRKVEA